MNSEDFQKIAEAADAARVQVSLSRYGWRIHGRWRRGTEVVEVQRSVPFQLVDAAKFNVLVAEIEHVASALTAPF